MSDSPSYVEFPHDHIIELHVKKPDEPPDPNEGDYECARYEQVSEDQEFNAGAGVDGSWIAGGAPIMAGPYGVAVPDPSNPAGVINLPMTNAKSVTIEWSLVVSEVSRNDNPGGQRIREWSGTAIGIGLTDMANLGYEGPPRPPEEPQFSGPGSAPGSFAVSATISVANPPKTYAVFFMSQGILTLHNVATETPGPAGWNNNRFPTDGLITITGTCNDG
jgi:hypothetical protein